VLFTITRCEWTDKNPIKLVRQSPKRERIPDVLEVAELQLLLTKLETRERPPVLLAAATGLRVSELLGIRWADVDFDTLELSVTRGKRPYWPDNLTKRYIKPVARKAGITKTSVGILSAIPSVLC
jgi:integrase